MPEPLVPLMDEALRADAVILVPELALAEVGEVLRKKEHAKGLTRKEVDTILHSLLRLPLEIVGHAELIEDALDIARRSKLTVYDALFLALARQRRCDLITADARLARAHRKG
jgi:predicted nucleic acid-binding protein